MAVLSLDDAKSHLNIGVDTYDVELAAIIEAAQAVIEHRCGPLELRELTVTVVGGGRTLVLPSAPISEVTSVTPHEGTALEIGTLLSDLDLGVVSYYDGGWFGDRQYVVEYVAGREDVPADLLLAVKELVRHLWATQRGPTRRPGSEQSDGPSAAYMLPNRVAELLAPHVLVSVA